MEGGGGLPEPALCKKDLQSSRPTVDYNHVKSFTIGLLISPASLYQIHAHVPLWGNHCQKSMQLHLLASIFGCPLHPQFFDQYCPQKWSYHGDHPAERTVVSVVLDIYQYSTYPLTISIHLQWFVPTHAISGKNRPQRLHVV